MDIVKESDEFGLIRINRLRNGLIQRTDTTNADRLIREFGKNIRYIAAWKKWLTWNGKYWQTDEGEVQINEYVKEMVRGIYSDVLDTSDYKERVEIEKFAARSESKRRISACIGLASRRLEIQIKTDDLDKDPMLLNVQNGTIDLRTGEFREHRQIDFITKITNVAYDQNAGCPAWQKFIREIMNYDNGLMMYVQTAMGWASTGDTREQIMFILYGSGANGKSTFLSTIMNLLGDYATTTPTETFIRKHSEQISNDLARLCGTRFVTCNEVELGKKLAEGIIKQVTGNDRIIARRLFSEYFTFKPTFKLLMATNHKPTVQGTDHGIWRRLKLIPFIKTIAPENQDKYLEEKLLVELPGILNYLIEGSVRWFNEGLKTPDAISKATSDYRNEMDIMGNFIRECCAESTDDTIKARELFRVYQQWCEQNNEHACSERILSTSLKEMGYKQKRLSDGRYWQDIKLNTTL